MAQAQNATPSKTPWTKIFSAFRIALDLKKLILAALGVVLLWAGWWVLGVIFYGTRSEPRYVVEKEEIKEKKGPEQVKAEWDAFKARRESWNLLHELAGNPGDRIKLDAGDVAEDPEEYKYLSEWEKGYENGLKPVTLKVKEKLLKYGDTEWTITPLPGDAAAFAHLPESIPLSEIVITDPNKKLVAIGAVPATVEGPFKKLVDARADVLSGGQIDEQIRELRAKDPRLADRTDRLFRKLLAEPNIKKSGLLRVSPWSEDRGGNPYLLVAGAIRSGGRTSMSAAETLNWFYSAEVPVLFEPLFKFLTPVIYMFDPRAGFWDRLYLIFIIAWTLAVWGFFGGAICRIAAVQFARNERISLKEAILFTKDRWVSYFAAPVFPLVLVAIFVFLLMIFGWIQAIPWFGEVFAGLLWPIVLLFGFIIAIVLVGLVGWPLMIATVSTEGTDSFDALSRSYSYVYQAPWRYLWYTFLAVIYGAVLVFFIGFMASLLVFLGAWGVSSAAGLGSSDPKYDREPSYLFNYAPTSFGWRDLLISTNMRYVEPKEEILYDGRKVTRLDFKPEYKDALSNMNKVGAVLVACWLYPLFLLLVGFGYSFFFSASTIIYFLMRHSVDDTEVEEVYLEDEELEDPFKNAPPPAPVVPPATGPKPGTLSLNLVDAPPPPPVPSPPPTSYTADVQPPPPIGSTPTAPPHDSPPGPA